jgi:hypothetical protein
VANVILSERIERSIFFVRSHKVMLDRDLAVLYGVTTFNLNKAVKRNADRFPEDFMFQLTAEEAGTLRFQIGMSKGKGRGGRRYLPYMFTEQGVAMLSSVLRSKRAVQVNVEIMRAFVAYGGCLPLTKSWPASWKRLKKDTTLSSRSCLMPYGSSWHRPEPNKRKIGFLAKERAARYG